MILIYKSINHAFTFHIIDHTGHVHTGHLCNFSVFKITKQNINETCQMYENDINFINDIGLGHFHCLKLRLKGRESRFRYYSTALQPERFSEKN